MYDYCKTGKCKEAKRNERLQISSRVQQFVLSCELCVWSCVVTCSVRVGGLSHLSVRFEFRLGCYDGGKFLGCLLRGDGNTCTTQRWSSFHPGCHLSRLVISVPWVPHGSAEERQNIFRAEVPKLPNNKVKKLLQLQVNEC